MEPRLYLHECDLYECDLYECYLYECYLHVVGGVRTQVLKPQRQLVAGYGLLLVVDEYRRRRLTSLAPIHL